VRPVLVALAARAAGATEVDGETQYVAELLHLALMVHDLEEDEDIPAFQYRVEYKDELL